MDPRVSSNISKGDLRFRICYLVRESLLMLCFIKGDETGVYEEEIEKWNGCFV